MTYKIARKDWWEFAPQVKDFYSKEGLCEKLIREEYETILKTCSDYSSFLEKSNELRDFIKSLYEQPNIPCFSNIKIYEYDEENYLFEILENSYFFYNNFEQWEHLITSVFYNGNSDGLTDEEVKEYIRIADWVDEQTEAGRYFLYPLSTKYTHDKLRKDLFLRVVKRMNKKQKAPNG